MKQEFKYKDIHTCEAVVLACLDFRFWRETAKFVEEGLKIKSYDFPKLPGAAKAINEDASASGMAMKCIDVACNLHHVQKIVIINHADCGAYGGSARFQGDLEAEQRFHESEIRRAKEKIAKIYPQKEILLAYAKLVDGGENIEFLRVSA